MAEADAGAFVGAVGAATEGAGALMAGMVADGAVAGATAVGGGVFIAVCAQAP